MKPDEWKLVIQPTGEFKDGKPTCTVQYQIYTGTLNGYQPILEWTDQTFSEAAKHALRILAGQPAPVQEPAQ